MGWTSNLVVRLRTIATLAIRAIRRAPFTLLIITSILATAAITNTLAHPIAPDMLTRWGYGIDQVRAGRFYQLLFAPFQIL
ncbi:MAG: hypothetical protein PVF33_08605, partial [Candidatus Latescibacterota bacterium]